MSNIKEIVKNNTPKKDKYFRVKLKTNKKSLSCGSTICYVGHLEGKYIILVDDPFFMSGYSWYENIMLLGIDEYKKRYNKKYPLYTVKTKAAFQRKLESIIKEKKKMWQKNRDARLKP